MQSKSINLPLIKEYINDVIEFLPNEQRISLFTNDKEYKNIESKYLKEIIKTITYSTNQLEYSSIKLKAHDLFSKNNRTEKELVIMSDLQLRSDSLKISYLRFLTQNFIKNHF